jgi:hypothetical protein
MGAISYFTVGAVLAKHFEQVIVEPLEDDCHLCDGSLFVLVVLRLISVA